MIRDPRARWWLLLGSLPVALLLFLVTWFALATEDDSFGEVLLVWMLPTLVVLAVARLPSWAFRVVTGIALLFEIPLAAFVPTLLVLVVIHLAAMFTRRPPPLGELRAPTAAA